MPAAKSPAPEDAAAARRMLLTGHCQDVPLLDLIGELAPLHPRNNTFPGEVFLRLATDALAWSGTSPAGPLPLEGAPGAVPARVCGPGAGRATARGLYPAGFLPLGLGNIRDRSLSDIYRNHPLLADIRAARFTGRCGQCEYADLCGGSPARAYAATGDPLGDDPACVRTIHG